MLRQLIAALLLVTLLLPVTAQDAELTLTPIGRYETGIYDEGAQEIGAYDAGTQRLFVTNAEANRIDVLDISDPTAPTLITQISLDDYGAGINSVAVHNGLIATAIDGSETGAAGSIVFLDTDGNILTSVKAGFLPDMVTFSPDGNYVLTANEGEPSDDYSIDPEGSVTIVDVSGGIESISDAVVTQVGFTDFNADGARAAELPTGVRIFGSDASVAQDLEPEYVAVSPDSTTAFAALQENNALAVIDIASRSVTAILALGAKDFSLEENAIDPSDADGGINIRPIPVMGMYQPDAIAAVEIDGQVLIVSANEGEARSYDTLEEEFRIEDDEIVLDAAAFPNADELKAKENIGRLHITNQNGDTDGDGDLDVLYTYGARSFTIWNMAGAVVFDSGSDFESILAEVSPETFNSNGQSSSFDERSDDKGVEPEGVTIGRVGNWLYAFITLERAGGIMVYNITDPANTRFVTYANNAIIDGDAEAGTAGDVAPESSVFISAENSPTGSPLLIVMNEVSGSTTIYSIESN